MKTETEKKLFLINDIPNFPEEKIREIKDIDNRIIVLESDKMTKDLLRWPGWEMLNKKETLIIFVGNGAQIVKDFINKEDPGFLKDWDSLKVNARRDWEPGEDPRSYVDTIGNRKQFFLKYKNIIVIDDVISSGSTIQKLYKENEVYFPSVKWKFLSWISLPIPQKIKKISDEFYSPQKIDFYEVNKKPPVNSLSTLVDKPERAENYARRNLGEKYEAFLKILKASKF